MVIEPKRGWLRLELRELWEYRDLLLLLLGAAGTPPGLIPLLDHRFFVSPLRQRVEQRSRNRLMRVHRGGGLPIALAFGAPGREQQIA